MDWEFEQATDGNIALIGEINLSGGMEFTLGVGFGCNQRSASAHLLQSFATPFADQREKYISQWQSTRAEVDLSKHTKDGGSMLPPHATGFRSRWVHVLVLRKALR